MNIPTHIRMREIELGEISKPRSKHIPIIHEDEISGLRREPKEKKSLYFYKLSYEVQVPMGNDSFITKTGEKDIYVKCSIDTKKDDIDNMAYNKLESNFMTNDRLIDSKIIFKKKVF